MTSEIQQTYYGWQHGELSEQDVSQGPISISQAIDHGSISFGRFAVESLSWEKRSVFAHNERQEELQKFKSPGLVAQKKAYFEEYYKKIRDLKAMQNLQTELSLEYGADGSISSQAGDDDEPAFPITRPIPESISQARVEELSFETSFENVDVEPEYLKHVTITKTFELQGNCNNSLQMQMSDPESLAHSLSIGSSEKIMLNEENYAANLTYMNDTKLKMKPDSAPLICLTDTKISDVIETYSVPVDNPILEKNKLIARMLKENPMPTPLSKGDTRLMATHNTVKNRSLQSKSIGHEEFEMNLENKRKTGEKRETTEQLTSRSINLPSRNNRNLNGVVSCKYGGSSCGDKSKKKQVTSGARKSFIVGNSSRQEIPRWR